MDKVAIKSTERETGIVYSYLLSREDAERILSNEGAYHIAIDEGEVMFEGDKIMIKTQGAPSSLDKREVMKQIEDQLA